MTTQERLRLANFLSKASYLPSFYQNSQFSKFSVPQSTRFINLLQLKNVLILRMSVVECFHETSTKRKREIFFFVSISILFSYFLTSLSLLSSLFFHSSFLPFLRSSQILTSTLYFFLSSSIPSFSHFFLFFLFHTL